jgi:hypothetical protein
MIEVGITNPGWIVILNERFLRSEEPALELKAKESGRASRRVANCATQ